MLNKTHAFFLIGTCLFLLSFRVADEVELDQFLNARSSPHFAEYSKNIKTTLAKGTKGEVVELSRPFSSGNFGVKLKITTGPKKGQSYWVYYNKKKPGLKLSEKKDTALVTRPVPATRALEEHVVVETAKKTSQVLSQDLSAVVNPPVKRDCNQEPVKREVSSASDCEGCFTPKKALSYINAGPLKFMGRDLMPGHDQNRTCLFENEKAYVLYHNCSGNRKEAPAMEVDVIAKEGGKVSFYMEAYNDVKISKTPREQYNGTWTVSFSPTAVPGKLDVGGVKNYLTREEEESTKGGCWVGEMGKASKMDTKAQCYGPVSSTLSVWGPEAESFWRDPGAEWLPTQSKLRKLVETVKF